jgi:hypothetical protein
MAMDKPSGDQAGQEQRGPKQPPPVPKQPPPLPTNPLPTSPRDTQQQEQSTQTPFPWGKLVVVLVLIFGFAVSRLLKHKKEDGGWESDRIVFTFMMCAIASSIAAGVIVFFHLRQKHQG